MLTTLINHLGGVCWPGRYQAIIKVGLCGTASKSLVLLIDTLQLNSVTLQFLTNLPIAFHGVSHWCLSSSITEQLWTTSLPTSVWNSTFSGSFLQICSQLFVTAFLEISGKMMGFYQILCLFCGEKSCQWGCRVMEGHNKQKCAYREGKEGLPACCGLLNMFILYILGKRKIQKER